METWYVLEGGAVVDPKDVAPDASGRLVHKSGIKVAMRGQVPSTRGVDVARVVAAAPSPKRGKNREVKAAAESASYETR